MKQMTIMENEAGQRLDKYLSKLLPKAPKSFFYKMLRKKNITLNKRKASGGEKLQCGDAVQLFLSQETFDKFSGEAFQRSKGKLDILYEDEQIILLNKPVGTLSQKGKPQDVSMVEYLITYLLDSGQITQKQLCTFHPGICNRLDRNTSGILVAGKTLVSLQELSRMFHDRILGKYYLCLVKGEIDKQKFIKGYLHKDEKCNKVSIKDTPFSGASLIETSYEPLAHNREMTLLRVHLITGKTHQIRSHLSHLGHPIAGDPKYGDRNWNRLFYEKYSLSNQLLHAAQLRIPEIEGTLGYLPGRQFFAPLPEQFLDILKKEHLEESIDDEDMARNMGIR